MISSETLILLRPDCLPWSHKLTTKSKNKLQTALNLLQQALAETDRQDALNAIERATEAIEPLEIIEIEELLPTNTSLEAWEIDDFDRFFSLKHVQATEPAICLVASLLMGYRALLQLDSCILFESNYPKIETQKSGFTSCVKLFARVFDLHLEEIP